MKRAAVALLASSVILSACGDRDLSESEQPAEAARIQSLVADVFAARDVCGLITDGWRDDGGCAEMRRVQASLHENVRQPRRPVSVGDDEIVDRRVHFDGRDRATVVVCYGDGDPCVSDLGAEVLTLERSAGRWRVAGHEYRVESF